MELTRSERVRRALTYQEVDRLPTQFNYTGSMGHAMAQHFGVPLADLPERLDNHLVRLDLTYEPRLSHDGRARRGLMSVRQSFGEKSVPTWAP